MQPGQRPSRALGTSVLAFTLVLWVPLFGLIDLAEAVGAACDRSRNEALDAGWGAIFGLVLPLGLLAQLRRPAERIAGLQLVGVVIVALAVAALAAEEWGYLVLVAALSGALAIVLALHPARARFWSLEGRQRRALSLLALASAIPCFAYASRMASAQRRDLPPSDDASVGLHHWTVMAAVALSIVLLLVLASRGTDGWWLPASGAAVLALVRGLSDVSLPSADDPISVGRTWAVLAIAFAITIAGVTYREARASGA